MKDLSARILLVDDDEQNLRLYEDVLRYENYAVAKARDGVEALEMFEKHEPDVVLLDLMMPRMNGYEVGNRLKHNPRAQDVPILMLSGVEEIEARNAALELGIDEFLTKPVDPKLLLSRVRMLLRLRFGQQALRRLQRVRGKTRGEIAQALAELDQMHSYLQTHPNVELSFRITKALVSCKRLDVTLAQM